MLLEEHDQGTAFIIGRFQPITKSHYQLIDSARKKYSQTYVVIINKKKPGQAEKFTKTGTIRTPYKKEMETNPFPLAVRMRLIHKAFGGKFNPNHIISAPTGLVTDIADRILNYTSKEKNKKKIVLFAGSDRVEDYKRLFQDYFEKDVPIEVVEISRDMDSADNVSATKVREAIKSGNKEEFMNLTPEGIHDEFENLKKYMMTEDQRSFFRQMLLEMIHIEDLNVEDFIDFVKNIYETEASVKLDGNVNVLAGIDDRGRFYTGLGKDFRDVPEDKRKYSVSDWLVIKHLKVNGPASAHAALESKIEIIKKFMSAGESFTNEVLFGDKPNSIKYDFGGTNYLVVLSNSSLAKALKGKINISVTNWILDSETLEQREVKQSWDFGDIEKVDPKSFEINIVQELKSLEDFLKLETAGFRNIDILGMKALGKKAEIVKEVRTKAQKLKINIKEKLLSQFVRKVKGGQYPLAHGYSHEGIVLKRGDKRTKIIDKEVFLKLHDQDWAPVNAMNKIVKQMSQPEAIEAINDMIINFDKLYPDIKDADTKKKMINNLKMTKLELKDAIR